MEFEEMKKIWDTQNNEPMYAINEAALHKRIRAKKHRASRMVNRTEIGLILVNVVAGGFLLVETLRGEEPLSTYLIVTFMGLVAGYLIVSRIRRLRKENRFDRSMLGDLDHAIANADYHVVLSRKVLWWYFIPLTLLTMLSFHNIGSVLLMLLAFALAFFLGKWELRHCHLPRKQELEALRDKLTEEVGQEVG